MSIDYFIDVSFLMFSSTQGDLFSFYELCKNFMWVTEDDKVGLCRQFFNSVQFVKSLLQKLTCTIWSGFIYL